MDSASLAAAILALGAVLVIFGIFALIAYIFMALALYTMAKNKGIDHAWLAWIPIVNNYLFGELIDDVVPIASLKIPYAKWVLLISPIVVCLLSTINTQNGFVSFIIWLVAVIYAVYTFAAQFRLFKLYKPESAVLFLVLSIIFSWVVILIPIFMFIMRNNTPVEYLEDSQAV